MHPSYAERVRSSGKNRVEAKPPRSGKRETGIPGFSWALSFIIEIFGENKKGTLEIGLSDAIFFRYRT
jgi:hypothetical protein